MLFLCFGLVFLLIVRLAYVFPKLAGHFRGQRLWEASATLASPPGHDCGKDF